MRISDWSSDVCSSDLAIGRALTTYGDEIVGRVLSMIGRAFKDQVLVGVGALFEALCAFIAERAKGGSPIDDELMEIMLTEVGIPGWKRSEEHTSELQSLMRISYAVFCLKKNKTHVKHQHTALTTKSVRTE